MSIIEPTIADLLGTARGLVARPEQWWQCTPQGHNAGNCICVGNAIAKVCTAAHVPVEMPFRMFAEAMGFAAARFSEVCQFIYDWNDAGERTHAEVLDAFDRAIAIASARRADGVLPPLTDQLEPKEGAVDERDQRRKHTLRLREYAGV
jgi:hypothetical protein